MKLSTRARYSVRMMMAIAKLSAGDTPVALGDAARHCGLSRRYLDQLVPPLRGAALVHARMGRSGGYVLGRPPEEIRLKDIIEAAIGPIAITDCVEPTVDCLHMDFCSCRSLWSLINRRICKDLEEFTLADLLDEAWPQRVAEELARLS